MEYFTIINFVLVFLGLSIGFVISKFLEKTSITKSFENAKIEAQNILKSASIEGENIKKDKIFQAKEKFLELKSEHEKHILNREKNLTDVQKRIKDKESQVSNELSINKKNNQSLNDKISSFDKKLELLDKKSDQVNKLHKEQVEKLEKLSSMSASEAKKELVQSLKEEAKTEALELKQNIFDAPISRTNDFEIKLNTTETEIVYKKHTLTIECPTFLLERRMDYLKETFWEYDPDPSIQDYGESEIIDEVNIKPENFSPNVLLRPLYQESILPNLCYIGGGSEISYWLELKNCFDSIKLDFPILLNIFS